jgi:uncharacterized protein YwgA
MTSSAAQRYALIAQLVHDYNAASGRIAGKKAVQKLFYVLQQRSKKVKHYGFSFYNYGVYSQELARDIAEAERYDFINVSYDEVTNAYSIRPSANFESNEQFVPSYYKAETCKDVFGRSAKELELITTIMFVCDEEKISDRKEILKRVRELKPKFSESEIKAHIVSDYCSP